MTEANDEFLRLAGRGRGELAEGRVTWGASTPPEFREQDRRMLDALNERGACGPYVKELGAGRRRAVGRGGGGDPDGRGRGARRERQLRARRLARRRAEEAVRLLAEAGEVLGGSLVDDVNLSSLARLVVPRLADVCVIDVVEAGGRVRRTAHAHASPARETVAGLENHPADLDGPSPVAGVLRTGRSLLIPEVDEADRRAATAAGDHRELVRRLNITSAMTVAMTARGRTLGAISFGAMAGRAGTTPRTSRWPRTWPVGRRRRSTTPGSSPRPARPGSRPRRPAGPRTSSSPSSRTSCGPR